MGPLDPWLEKLPLLWGFKNRGHEGAMCKKSRFFEQRNDPFWDGFPGKECRNAATNGHHFFSNLRGINNPTSKKHSQVLESKLRGCSSYSLSGLICELFSIGLSLLTGLTPQAGVYKSWCYYRNHFRFVGWSSKYRFARLLPTFAPTVFQPFFARHVKTMQWSTSLDNTSSASWQTIFYINGNLKW